MISRSLLVIYNIQINDVLYYEKPRKITHNDTIFMSYVSKNYIQST